MMAESPQEKQRPWGAIGLILGGLLLFLFAAGGGTGVFGLPLTIESNGWKLGLSAVGLVLMAIGVLRLADQRTRAVQKRSNGKMIDVTDCQINILRPQRFHRRMTIEGVFLNEPPEGTLRLFTVMEHGRFRPQSIVTFDVVDRRWSGQVDLGPGPYYSVNVVVAFVDETAIALWDYYFKVGKQTNWEPVEGPFSDILRPCDSFLVEGIINE